MRLSARPSPGLGGPACQGPAAPKRREERYLNNLLKNVGIWLVIVLVVRDRGQAVRLAAGAEGHGPVFRVHGQGQGRRRRVGDRRGPHDRLGERRQEALHHLQPRTTSGWSATWSSTASRSTRKPDEEQKLPRAGLHLVVPDAAPDRRVDLLHAPDAGRRARRRVHLRQEQGADARRVEQHDHVRRRRRLRRGEGGGLRAGRVPPRPDRSSRSWAAAFRAAC